MEQSLCPFKENGGQVYVDTSDMLLWSHKHVIKLGVNADTSDLELKPQGMEEGRSGVDAGLVGSAWGQAAF